MTRSSLFTIPTLTLVLAAGAAAPAAAGDAWRLSISGVSAQSTAGSGSDGSLGVGASVQYRVTPLVGVALAGLTGEVDGLDIDFFRPGRIETEIRMTPILARLDLHLTPGPRTDLYLGPVGGHVSLSDVTVHDHGVESRIRTEDQLAWGGHVGFDVRLGDGRSSLTAGATWLDLPLELEFDFDVPTLEGEADLIALPAGGDLDPLIVQVGWSYRF